MDLEKYQLAKKIGRNIKTLREARNINQSELSRRCYKDPQWMEKIEHGKVNPTIYSLYIISIALEVPLEELMKL